RTRELSAMVAGSGSIGPRNWRGQVLRSRTERWVRSLVKEARAGTATASMGSALEIVAHHREPDGRLPGERTAAVELINLLRPTLAVGRYIVFTALALHLHPEHRERLQTGEDAEAEAFVQEVRRYFPFFPFVGGKVMEPFDWRGHRFGEGDWVLL